LIRNPKSLLLGFSAALCLGLVGCTSSPNQAPQLTQVTTSPSATPSNAQPQLALQTGARQAAASWYHLSSSGQLTASWQLLAAAVKKQIPLKVWVAVHEGCPAANTGVTRTITSVTVLGTAAIVTEKVTGPKARNSTSNDVFNLGNGQWTYSPNDINVYQHSSVAADITAAKAKGLCDGSQSAPL
jgi:hypothetical protein